MKKTIVLAIAFLAVSFSRVYAQCDPSPDFAKKLSLVVQMGKEEVVDADDDTLLNPKACDAIVSLIQSVKTESDFILLSDTLDVLMDNFELGYVVPTSRQHEQCDEKIEAVLTHSPFMINALNFAKGEMNVSKASDTIISFKKKFNEYSNYQKVMLFIAGRSTFTDFDMLLSIDKPELTTGCKQLRDSSCRMYALFADDLTKNFSFPIAKKQ